MRLRKRTILKRGLLDYHWRIVRLYGHLISPVYKISRVPQTLSFIDYFGDLPWYIFDLLFLPEVIDLSLLLAKPKTRTLTTLEMYEAKSVFGSSIDYQYVGVDETAKIMTKKHQLAYVQCGIINFFESINSATFIHEMVHVWQFQRYGSVYIYRALKAQHSKAGYNFGGFVGLVDAFAKNKRLVEFNFEQMASIVESLFVQRQSEDAVVDPTFMAIYQYFDIRNH